MIIFETLKEPKIFLLLIIFGFLCGFLFDISYLITFLCKENKIIKNIFQFFSTIICFFVVFLINLKLNYGIFRAYVFISFFFAVFLERISVGKLFAKTKIWCYNLFKKFVNFTKEKLNGKRKENSKNNVN